MKIAVPTRFNRVSPVLDVARFVRMYHVEHGSIVAVSNHRIHQDDQGRSLSSLEADILLCGAVSAGLLQTLRAADVPVIHDVCGPSDEVVSAYLEGRLREPRYWMPGTRSVTTDLQESGAPRTP